MDPALRRDSRAEVSFVVSTVGAFAGLFSPVSFVSVEVKEEDLKGDVAGLGLAFRFCEIVELVNKEPPLGGNLEGTVPARARRVGLSRLLSEGGMKSGNPS